MGTFRSGVHPKGNKSLTEDIKISIFSDFGYPKKVYIPVSQFAGEQTEVLVAKGDEVKKGQLIGKRNGKFGVNIHSSVSGTVLGIVKKPTLQGFKVDHIEIENNFLDVTEKLPPLGERTKEALRERLADAGIIGMGGAAFPTHFKLNVPPDRNVDTLVVNGAECEPYITCDNRLMLEKAAEVISGVKIIAEILGVSRVVIGIEDNKEDAVKSLLKVDGTSKYLKDIESKVVVLALHTKYPQGAEKMLIHSTLKRQVPPGKLPSDVGVAVCNIHTSYAVHMAVEENTPVSDRIVTISGLGVEKKGNYVMPIGTLFCDVAEALGAHDEDVREVISGGPMMGASQFSLDRAITKATSSILFLKEEEVSLDGATTCINCGKCAKACPMHLMPMYIDGNTLSGDYETAKKYGAMDCMECGCCSFTCPAKRPLVQSIRLAKKMIRTRGI